MERLNGIVKQVISADTYVLTGAVKDGVAQERQISLACINCPKLFMKSQSVEKNEEPFAWESREFIRKMIIGKNVSFVVEYTYNNRTYCSVFFEGQNLSILLLEKGYANLVSNKNVKTNVYADLESYYTEAKERKIGIFSNNINYYVRDIVYSYNDKNENKKLYDSFLNRRMKCIVEHVRDGSNFRVFAECVENEKRDEEKNGNINAKTNSVNGPSTGLNNDLNNTNKKNNSSSSKRKKNGNYKKKMNEDDQKKEEKYLTMYYFSFYVCGIIVDMFKKEIVNNVETVKEELYAMETKKFVESRLLNRDIEIEIKHLDNNCNLYANVYYKLGNICTLLLKNGYAYINEYTIKYVDNAIEYKRALDEAIQLRKKKWINYTEKKVDFEKEYFTTVVEVLYGDVIIVDYKNEERRLYMASIKCEKHNTDLKLNTLCILAKDYLKSQIVGERVKIVTEYVRTPQSNSDGYIPQCSDDKGRMHFVTVYKLGKKKSNQNTRKESLSNIWEEEKNGKKVALGGSKLKGKKGVDGMRSVNGVSGINGVSEVNGIKSTKSGKNAKIKLGEKLLNGGVNKPEEEEYINLNEQLVSRGLARVISQRQEDEKASNYFHLQELEKEAEQKKVGRFNQHIDIIKINNISGSDNALRARSFENVLNKYNNLNACVDFIYGANRFKLHIPSQNLLINFILLGISVQKINLKDLGTIESNHKKVNEEYLNGDEIKKSKKEKIEYREIAIQAYKYTRKMLMQRNVQISIVTCDKGGNFIGILKYQNKDFSVHLLSLGYGVLNEIGLNNTNERNNYVKAAEEAKKHKRNIWSIEKTEDADNLLNVEKDLSAFDNIYYCSYVDDITNICIQLKSKQEQLKKLQDELNKNPDIDILSSYTLTEINKNSLVMAKYVDKCYYRAVVLQVNKSKKKAIVKYIDFGNEEELDFIDIKKLNDSFNLKNYIPFSIKVALAGLKIPAENKTDLIIYIKKFLLDKYLYVKFEKKENNTYYVVFYDYEQFTSNKNVKSVNEELVFNGICYVDNLSDTKIFEKLKREEALAKKNKLVIWSYGDIDYDDEN
ncbi:tudor staphylococcal nuclease, putative [Plasmodium malariae]|uniref:Tudor staphylococcal nuclease, putative n=1 Tax=Plasmodium malariae TaxID=5858 RepID=A0A1D3PCL6_PLAMA|nr:tudor staphylococcal nuclease, putative [Plasmodium malariae]SCN12881.1 tudor staphylococcal nuclease, putative [Plasmodium malariae]